MAIEESHFGFLFSTEATSLLELNNLMRSAQDLCTFQKLRNHEQLNIINMAKPLFRVDFPKARTLADWLILHLERAELSYMQMMLIDDTVKYLKTGQRRMPLAYYEQMSFSEFTESVAGISRSASYNPSNDLTFKQQANKLIYLIREEEREESLFFKWVSTLDGLWDLVAFLRLVTTTKESMLK